MKKKKRKASVSIEGAPDFVKEILREAEKAMHRVGAAKVSASVINNPINNQKPDAKVKIHCRCGNVFTVPIPITLVRTWQTHKCTQCPRRFKTHYLEKELGGTGWTIYSEGQLCDLCHKAPPIRDALSGPPPDGKLFHLCQSCFDEQQKKSSAKGPIKTVFYSK